MKSNELRRIQIELFSQLLRQAKRNSENFAHSLVGQANVTGVNHHSLAFYLSALFKEHQKLFLILVQSDKDANELQSDLSILLGESTVGYYPELNVLPYEDIAPSRFVLHQRADALFRLSESTPSMVVSSIQAAARFILDRDIFRENILEIEIGRSYARANVLEDLTRLGYELVSKVREIGEYSSRGEILDIYSSAYTSPIRIEFFDDEVESIRLFHVDTQVSFEGLQAVKILPKKDNWIGEQTLRQKMKALEKERGSEVGFEAFKNKIREHGLFSGFHQYLPLFSEKKMCLLDYLNSKDSVVVEGGESIFSKIDILLKEYGESYALKSKAEKFKLAPHEIFTNTECFKKCLAAKSHFFTSVLRGQWGSEAIHIEVKAPTHYKGDLSRVSAEIEASVSKDERVVMAASHAHQVRRLGKIFAELKPTFLLLQEQKINEAREALRMPFVIVQANFSRGFYLPQAKLKILCEHEIFGRKKKINRHEGEDPSRVLESFLDLKENDYAVHINHGIGIYRGLKRLHVKGKTKDFLKIEYAGKANLFIPVEQINFIQKYIGTGESVVKIDQLGGKAWDKLKKRVRRSVEDIAKDLIKLYSKRKITQKLPFVSDTPWQAQFEADFPFEETPDQLKASEELKQDMEKSKLMDRLICGDVGFGKTEVAMRAAFKATMDSRQVVLLCPTTILSQQHYHTFKERFVDYPVNIEVINRFKSPQDQKKILQATMEGKIDILIGTHRLLSKDVGFKQLGLLVIDEEQKFGVKHKEKIRELAKEVDTLALSATPIPRTLHMSLINIRAINIMTTPPLHRLPVQTFVMEIDDNVIIEAVEREIKRNGQMYFLHNRVETIAEVAMYIRRLCPQLKIAVAHGQMDESQLEQTMNDFIAAKYDMLLATTIIDSGLDIPNANTMFIHNAHYFGLSQLYQLRGRVGRSTKQGYAYLFYPKNQALNEDAMERLQGISEHTELGSGFKIAMKDLEIRGAGNVLGREQSGNIIAVGFEMYCQLLEEAIGTLKPEKKKPKKNCVMDIKYDGFIPHGYIADNKEKIEVYKKISSIKDDQSYREVEGELQDRFGKMPPIIKCLFEIARLRVLAEEAGFISLIEKMGKLEVILAADNLIDPHKMMRRISKQQDITAHPSNALAFHLNLPEMEGEVESKQEFDAKMSFIQNFIKEVT